MGRARVVLYTIAEDRSLCCPACSRFTIMLFRDGRCYDCTQASSVEVGSALLASGRADSCYGAGRVLSRSSIMGQRQGSLFA